MWNLEYELIAILLLSAIIGLFMGRFLCKSGESEEKSKNRKLQSDYKSLEVNLKKTEEQLAEQVSKIQEYENRAAIYVQKIANLETQLESSNKHGAGHLEDLKVLEKYKMRYEALSNEFEVQSRQIGALKDEKSQHIETIHNFETKSRILEQNLLSLTHEHTKLTETFDELMVLKEEQKSQLESLTLEKERLEKLLKNYKIEKHDRLEFLEKEYTSTVDKLNELIDEREDLVARIRAISSVVGAVGVEED